MLVLSVTLWRSRKNSRHHNIANGEGKWVKNLNSRCCPFNDPSKNDDRRFTFLTVYKSVNFKRLREKIR